MSFEKIDNTNVKFLYEVEPNISMNNYCIKIIEKFLNRYENI